MSQIKNSRRCYHRYDWDHSRKVSTIRSIWLYCVALSCRSSKVHSLVISLGIRDQDWDCVLLTEQRVSSLKESRCNRLSYSL
jgi:hypothetical protein